MNVETAVSRTNLAQAIDSPGHYLTGLAKSRLIANKVKWTALVSPCESSSCAFFARPTAVSRIKRFVAAVSRLGNSGVFR